MKKLGKQPRRHDFFLNPYQDWRFSRCPKCDEKTRLRKFPLVIHVGPRKPRGSEQVLPLLPGL